MHEDDERNKRNTWKFPPLDPQPPREEAFGEMFLQEQRAARRPYRAVWDDAVEKIRAKTWPTRKAMARHYGQSYPWICSMVQLMTEPRQQVFSQDELRELLPGRYLKKKTRRTREHRNNKAPYGRSPEVGRPTQTDHTATNNKNNNQLNQE